jgi:N-acetylmuramic acid 6-phosphate (MurNAc-6-P) etherase
MVLQKKSYEQLFEKYERTQKKLMDSRDKKIVKEITKVENEYEKKLSKLEKAAYKTIEPNLQREWKQARKEYLEFLEKIRYF